MLQELLQGFVAETAPVEGGGAVGGLIQFLPFLAIFAVMYFLIIRPQQKQQKEQQLFLSQLKKGDEVLLQGGLFGKVFAVADGEVTVEIAKGVQVRALKSAVVRPSTPAAGETAKTESEKKA